MCMESTTRSNLITLLFSYMTYTKNWVIKCPSVKFFLFCDNSLTFHTLEHLGIPLREGKQERDLFGILDSREVTMTLWCRKGNVQLSYLKNPSSIAMCSALVYVFTARACRSRWARPIDNGCDAAASQLEPSFASHMFRAQVMAIMTAVVAGLQRGYDRLRKSHGLLPLGGGGSIKWNTTMFFSVSHSELLQKLVSFKGI